MVFRAWIKGPAIRPADSELADGSFDPLQRFPEERTGTGQVHPLEAPQFLSEARPGVEQNAGFPEEKGVESLLVHTEGPAIEKGEVAGLRPEENERQNPRCDEIPGEIHVRIEIGKKLIQPLRAVGVGGLEGDDAEDVAHDESRFFGASIEAGPEGRVGGDDDRYVERPATLNVLLGARHVIVRSARAGEVEAAGT